MAETLVRARETRRIYRSGTTTVTAVRDASFEIGVGDHISLVGPSGSGKTTLLHLIGGLDRATAGDIEWPGLGRFDALRPGPVTIAFQGPSLLPPLTVVENVALPLLLARAKENEALEAARERLKRFEIADLADKLPEELSGGQLQRAGLARALAGAPQLVLVDEPTGHQDGTGRDRVMAVLLSATSELGAALLVATHDRSVAERFPIRWSMEDGRLSTGEA
jgi:ABC-type lipoprotein export system ATPase subunit